MSLAALLSAATTGALAQDPSDTSKLPRPGNAKVIYESPQTTILTTTRSSEATAAEVEKLLADAGWQNYRELQERREPDPAARTLVARKGAIGLQARIAPAPAQGNATTVNFIANPLRHDLPFPPEAHGVKFDQNLPLLEATTPQTFEAVATYYTAELKQRGWDLFQPTDGSQPISGDAKNQRAFFTKTGQRPWLLLMRTQDGGSTAVKIEAVSPQLLPTAKPAPQAQAAPPAPKSAPPAAPSAIDKQIDSLIGDVLRDTQRQIAGAARAPQPGATRPAEPALKRKADATAPIPLPDTAGDAILDPSAGLFEFESSSSVRALADFYRSEMRKEGWSSTPTPINRDNMAVLSFSRAGKSLTLTLMQFGAGSRVSAQGDALEQPDGSNAGATASTAAGDKTKDDAPDVALEAGESGGLPVPKPNNSVGNTTSLFRHEAFAAVPAKLENVLAFYRRELAAHGWSEIGAAKIDGGKAIADFKSPEGPARLTLERKDSETHATLAVRKEVEAQKSGLMPKKGMVRLLFGSMADGSATVSITGRSVAVAPGVGLKKPDGPTLEVPPGSHKVTVKVGKQPPQTEAVTVAADEIWGLLIGPGGILPLQAY